jgi:hypothetical protein
MIFVTELREEIDMKNRTTRLSLTVAIGIALVLLPLLARASSANFNVVATPVTVDPGTCDPNTFLPCPGAVACEARETLDGPVTGDVTGNLFAEALSLIKTSSVWILWCL